MIEDYEKENYGNHYLSYEEVQGIVSRKMMGSIGWMVLGLMISGAVGFFTVTNESLFYMAYKLYFPLILVELAVVVIFTMRLLKASVTSLRIMFLLYSALNGITLSFLGIIYTGSSLTYIFLGTLVYFTCLATYGYFTKEDLSKYRVYAMGALMALIVVSVVNFFLKSTMTDYFISYAGVLIFTAFTAIDTNIIRRNLTAYAVQEDETILDRIQICGALNLYLDFINLFMYLLRIFGKKR